MELKVNISLNLQPIVISVPVSEVLGKTKAVDGFVCTKRTYGLKISYKNYHSLIRARPAFEQLLNLINDKANQNIRDRLTSFQSMDAKGRYELMLSQYPDVFEKFTMQDISNYMGIKAETLSRLKKKSINNIYFLPIGNVMQCGPPRARDNSADGMVIIVLFNSSNVYSSDRIRFAEITVKPFSLNAFNVFKLRS